MATVTSKKVVEKGFGYVVRKFFFNISEIPKHGLLTDDIQRPAPIENEATRRFMIADPEGYDQKVYRTMRAQLLYMQKKILPEDQQTDFDDDPAYLTPYLEEVKAEIREKHEWERQ